jgi:1-acyl-sn-glycerol-3-phosphate acyltransferase
MPDAPLSRLERFALRFAELANETPRGKWLQTQFLRSVSYTWVRAGIARRVLADGLDRIMQLEPDTGVMLVSNHRSFFDQYVMLLACYMGPVSWAKRLYFPVRSNFFYDQPLGLFVNAAVAAGAMYPPIYRQAERRALNDDAIDRMVHILRTPGSVLGMHPEGTRGKGPNPYVFLPAQPGVGKLAVVARPLVIPTFILGLGNNIVQDIRWNFERNTRRDHAVLLLFGEPFDLAPFLDEKPRPTVYKRVADALMQAIGALSAREKELRVELRSGRISEDDPRWLTNRPIGKLYAREG